MPHSPPLGGDVAAYCVPSIRGVGVCYMLADASANRKRHFLNIQTNHYFQFYSHATQPTPGRGRCRLQCPLSMMIYGNSLKKTCFRERKGCPVLFGAPLVVIIMGIISSPPFQRQYRREEPHAHNTPLRAKLTCRCCVHSPHSSPCGRRGHTPPRALLLIPLYSANL